MARCGFGCSLTFLMRRKCLLRDHHKRCHKGLPHQEPILDRTPCYGKSDTINPPMREERSRSPLREIVSYENQNRPPKTRGLTFSEEELLIELQDLLVLENLA